VDDVLIMNQEVKKLIRCIRDKREARWD